MICWSSLDGVLTESQWTLWLRCEALSVHMPIDNVRQMVDDFEKCVQQVGNQELFGVVSLPMQ